MSMYPDQQTPQSIVGWVRGHTRSSDFVIFLITLGVGQYEKLTQPLDLLHSHGGGGGGGGRWGGGGGGGPRPKEDFKSSHNRL